MEKKEEANTILLTAFIIERYFTFCVRFVASNFDRIIAHLMVIDLMAMFALEVGSFILKSHH